MAKRVGVLALQGAVSEHLAALKGVGAEASEVREANQLESLDGLILPGGESTTIGLLLTRFGLVEPLLQRARQGLALWGTCAGMILLARRIHDGLPGQLALGLLDIEVRRNASGRQIDSCEVPLDITATAGEPFPAVFIRAPLAVKWGPEVEVLARDGGGGAVALRQGNRLVTSFHPELSDDDRMHRYFVEALCVERPRPQVCR